MTVELLYLDGCPGHERLLERFPNLLEHAGIPTQVTLRKITDAEHAQRERFLGSPSVRVDGRDVDPGAKHRADYGLKCRLYQTAGGLSGLPPDEWILGAVTRRPDN
jgi:hypothetical protein